MNGNTSEMMNMNHNKKQWNIPKNHLLVIKFLTQTFQLQANCQMRMWYQTWLDWRRLALTAMYRSRCALVWLQTKAFDWLLQRENSSSMVCSIYIVQKEMRDRLQQYIPPNKIHLFHFWNKKYNYNFGRNNT